MQKIWELYQEKDFVMLGVPSNDFGQQEPGTNKEIKNFCEAKFGITFPMTEKVSVKGNEAHPFYIWAKENHGKSAVPKWNFHKIIINKEGKIENKNTPICLPKNKPAKIPKGTGSINELIDIPSKETPAFAKAKRGIIPKAT